jgi:hypothetical protein
VLLRINSQYFVAGVVVGGRAAPIIKYMSAWSEEQIRAYCQRKGWKVEEVRDAVDSPTAE